MMGINKSTVYNLIKKLDRKSKPTKCKKETSADETQPVEIIEMDYTKAKKQGLRNNVGNKKTSTIYKF